MAIIIEKNIILSKTKQKFTNTCMRKMFLTTKSEILTLVMGQPMVNPVF